MGSQEVMGLEHTQGPRAPPSQPLHALTMVEEGRGEGKGCLRWPRAITRLARWALHGRARHALHALVAAP